MAFSLEIMFVKAKQLWRGKDLSDQQVLDLLEGRARCYSRFLQDFQDCLMGSWYTETTERFAVIFF